MFLVLSIKDDFRCNSIYVTIICLRMKKDRVLLHQTDEVMMVWVWWTYTHHLELYEALKCAGVLTMFCSTTNANGNQL